MKKRAGYAGNIRNSGAQKVQAPFGGNTPKGKATVQSGDDLRTGKKQRVK